MKLIFDVAKFVVVNFARLVLLATVVGLGALGWKHLKPKIEENPRASMQALIGQIEALRVKEVTAMEAENLAYDAYQGALARFESDRQKAQDAFDLAVVNRQEPFRVHQSLHGRFVNTISRLGLSDELSFSPENTEKTFVDVCVSVVGIEREYCSDWLEEAKKQTSGLMSENWHENLVKALRSNCGRTYGVWSSLMRFRIDDLLLCTVGKPGAEGFALTFAGGVNGYRLLQDAKEKLNAASALVDEAAGKLSAIVPPDASYLNTWEEARTSRQDVQAEIQKTTVQLEALRSDPWNRAVEGYHWFVENLLKKYWFTAFLILLMPYVIAWLVYQGARIVEAWPAFRLRKRSGEKTFVGAVGNTVEFYETLPEGAGEASVKMEMGVRQPTVQLSPREKLVVRAEYVASSRNGTTAVFLSNRHFFSSYAAGMWGLTKFTGEKTPMVVLSASGVEHHDEYIAKVTLTNHPGFIVRPSRVIAVKGDLGLVRRWNFGVSSWMRFQFGYFHFVGTGELYIAAPGGVLPRVVGSPDAPEGREHLSHDLILGWDGGLGMGFARNENFIQSALLRRQDLFESALTGHGPYLQGHSSKEHKVSGATKLFSGFLDIVLKIFGI